MQTYFNNAFILSLFFLLGLGFITAFNTALLKLGKYQSKEKLKIRKSRLFFFRFVLFRFFSQDEWNNLYFCISATKNLLSLLYASSAFMFFLLYLGTQKSFVGITSLDEPLSIIFIALIIIAISILVDFTFRLLGTLSPAKILRVFAPIASFYLTLFSPITFILLKITRIFFALTHVDEHVDEYFFIKEKIKEILSDTQKHLDPYDQKLISSFITFRERVAREIMIPRVDLCTIAQDTTIKQSTSYFIHEGYSRIPVYKETMDHILGVILYKDILKVFAEPQNCEVDLNSPVEKIVKPVIYAPENKKISHLLQEFKAKQTHLAIIVNEYGGTEGIVTIEDILEELVGEIEDESDVEEDEKFQRLPEGAFIVNAKMSVVDIEDELDIKIPHHPEYETVGGFIFHKAGTIPKKGWSIHLDEFELEVIASDERSVKKILITPTNPSS